MAENTAVRHGGSYKVDPQTGKTTLISRTEAREPNGGRFKDPSNLPPLTPALAPTPTPKPKTKPKEVTHGTL